ETQTERISNGEFDLGIVRGGIHRNELMAVPLLVEDLMIVAHEDSLVAQKDVISMAELANESIMISPRETAMTLYDQTAALCQKAGFQLRPSLLAVQFPTLVGLVAARRGVAILPASMSVLKIPRVRYVPIKDEGTASTLSLIMRRDRMNRPGFGAIIERLEQELSRIF